MSVEEVHDAFSALTDDEFSTVSTKLRHALTQARQELEAIRFGMCESGQRGEINRIPRELDLAAAESRNRR